MKKNTKRMLVAGAVVVAFGAVGGGVAVAGGEAGEAGSDDFTQQQAEDATAAALAATGGGTANSVERDSENGATYEVEVSTPAGETVDVRLDEAYEVVVIEGDVEDGNNG